MHIALLFFLIFGSTSAKELRIGMASEFENLNPIISNMLATSYIYAMVGRRMVSVDTNNEWSPQLATKIPTFENGLAKFVTRAGVKQIAARWTLRKGVKWGDGKPVTCEDLRFTWVVARNDNVSVPGRQSFDSIKDIQTNPKNPLECVVFSEVRWDYFKNLAFGILPKHIEEPIYKKYREQPNAYDRASSFTTNPMSPGLYNGPYVISDLKLGSHVILKKNPHFYGSKPKIDRIVVKLIPNTGTLEANLRSGTIDMISRLGLTFDQALALKKRAKKEKLPIEVNIKTAFSRERISVRMDHPILKDLNVRKALMLATPRQELVDALFEGLQPPGLHLVCPPDPWFTEDPKKITVYPYSRRQAKNLLDEAGWKMKKDGFRYKNGKRLAFSLKTTVEKESRKFTQVLLKNRWQQIGVDLELKNYPSRVFFAEHFRKREFDLAMSGTTTSPMNPYELAYMSTNIPSKQNGYSGNNRTGWSNKDVDSIYIKLRREFSAIKRKKLVHQLLKLYTEDLPEIPLYYRTSVSVTPEKMRGYTLVGHSSSPTNHVELWDLVEKK